MIHRATDLLHRYFLFFLPEELVHPWDFVAHFLVSFTLVLVVFVLLRVLRVGTEMSFVISVAVAITLGVVKEINDFVIGKDDIVADLFFDAVGIACAIAIIILTRYAISIVKNPLV